MSYKISDTAMIIESDGKAILVAKEAEYITSLSVGSTGEYLADGYFTDYFYSFQGSTSGYVTGGSGYGFSLDHKNIIQKFPFAADTDASDVGDLSSPRVYSSGISSEVNGYSAGGNGEPPSFGQAKNFIDKFPFASDDNGSDIADLTQARGYAAGHSTGANGYVSGGSVTPPTLTFYTTIDKFPFSSDANATNVGDITQARDTTGQSSQTHGYTSGGRIFVYHPYSPNMETKNTIDKFPFAIDAGTGTDVGDLSSAEMPGAGQSSLTHGYHSGGNSPPYNNIIDKFPFAADANATDVGDLTNKRSSASGQSSKNHGYTSGGSPVSPLGDRVDKFPFASDANATDVGNLTEDLYGTAGQQV